FFYFFFSSRRRHTRSKRDWSSDVCSSDLSRMQHIRLELSRDKEGFIRLKKRKTLKELLKEFQEEPYQYGLYRGENGFLRLRPRKIGRASCRERVYEWVGES